MSHMNLAISRRVTTPLALSMAVTAVAMMWATSYPLRLWLIVAIALYVFLVGWSLVVQQPASQRIIDAMVALRAAGGPTGPPPPDVAALIGRTRLGGKMLGVVILVVVALMVWKPGA